MRSRGISNHRNVATQVRRLARRTTVGDAYRRRAPRQRLAQVVDLGVSRERIHLVEHHTAHAAAAYYAYGVYDEPVLVLTNDGAGDGLCASVRTGRGGHLQPPIATVSEADSIGNVFAVITFLMGMGPLEHETSDGSGPYAPHHGRDAVLASSGP